MRLQIAHELGGVVGAVEGRVHDVQVAEQPDPSAAGHLPARVVRRQHHLRAGHDDVIDDLVFISGGILRRIGQNTLRRQQARRETQEQGNMPRHSAVFVMGRIDWIPLGQANQASVRVSAPISQSGLSQSQL